MINIKRVYSEPGKADGFRILVDRLWPRGMTKDKAKVDLWLKEIAPSNDLRKWFAHDPGKWETFRDRYLVELINKQEFINRIRQAEKEFHTVTLLFAARDETHNEAAVLKEIL